jgi:nicotinamidase/pyrazinamidase
MNVNETVLLLIDIQNDFCRGGALEVPQADEVIAVVNRLGQKFQHIVLTQDWHPPGHESFASTHEGHKPYDVIAAPYGQQTLWPDHCIQGTQGAQLHPSLDVPRAQLVVRKGYRREIDSYSAFYENDHRTPTGLGGYLREIGISRVFVAGLAFDFCVRYSAEDARREGLEVTVIEDACRGIDANGSIEDTRRSFARAGIHLVDSQELLRDS